MSLKKGFNRLFGLKEDESRPKSLGGRVNHNNASSDATNKKEADTEAAFVAEQGKKVFYNFNLIILDESGSMSGFEKQTVTGCNETLNSIRTSAKDHPDTKQVVSIFCFDTSNSRYLICNKPIEEVSDLSMSEYRPNACTPLYDAIGYTVTQLQKAISGTDAIGLVTIITDGYENASQRWNHRSVVELIDSLKKNGWVFTFIGADIDVKGTANGLGIDSYMAFDKTDEGMSAMFYKDSRSRWAYHEKLAYARRSGRYQSMSAEEKGELLSSMNMGFFVDKDRIAPDIIQRLESDQVFVFGSNVLGHHDGGAAQYALQHFGAVYGQAEGIQGQSYAIPTVGNTFEEIKEAVNRFNEYVVCHPEQKFMLTAIGCGSAGYTAGQIAPLFRQAYKFGNVYVPAQFMQYMEIELKF